MIVLSPYISEDMIAKQTNEYHKSELSWFKTMFDKNIFISNKQRVELINDFHELLSKINQKNRE